MNVSFCMDHLLVAYAELQKQLLVIGNALSYFLALDPFINNSCLFAA